MSRLYIGKRWIASSNAEWGWSTQAGGPYAGRGRTIAEAVRHAEDAHPQIRERGCTIVVEPDDTSDQAHRAREGFFGR